MAMLPVPVHHRAGVGEERSVACGHVRDELPQPREMAFAEIHGLLPAGEFHREQVSRGLHPQVDSARGPVEMVPQLFAPQAGGTTIADPAAGFPHGQEARGRIVQDGGQRWLIAAQPGVAFQLHTGEIRPDFRHGRGLMTAMVATAAVPRAT